MMFADGQWQIILPEFPDPVGILFPVFIDIEVYPRSLRIDIVGNLPRWIECFGIRQIIHQLCKGSGHFVRVIRGEVLVFQPAVFIPLYNQGFPQSMNFACKILFLK